MALSVRLGRTSTKEQYAYFYRYISATEAICVEQHRARIVHSTGHTLGWFSDGPDHTRPCTFSNPPTARRREQSWDQLTIRLATPLLWTSTNWMEGKLKRIIYHFLGHFKRNIHVFREVTFSILERVIFYFWAFVIRHFLSGAVKVKYGWFAVSRNQK